MALFLKSKYSPIPHDSLEDEPVSLSQDTQQIIPLVQAAKRKHLLSTFTILNFALLVIHTVLIGLYGVDRDLKSGSIEMEFGRNYDYMSLDHKYDHLWEQDVAANEAGIIILKEHGGRYGEIEHGAISM